MNEYTVEQEAGMTATTTIKQSAACPYCMCRNNNIDTTNSSSNSSSSSKNNKTVGGVPPLHMYPGSASVMATT